MFAIPKFIDNLLPLKEWEFIIGDYYALIAL
jgi:hypothetical protein